MAHVATIIENGTAEQAVRDLAQRYRISPVRSPIDNWADDVTRLSGDEVSLDEVEELIVGLRRSGAVDGTELTRLHSRYLDERDSA